MSRCRHVQLIAAESGWRVADAKNRHFPVVAWSLCETGCEVDVDHGSGLTTRSFAFDPVSKECDLDDRWRVDVADRGRVIHAVVIGAGGPDPVCVGALELKGAHLIAPRATLRAALPDPVREETPPGGGVSLTGSMGTEVGRGPG